MERKLKTTISVQKSTAEALARLREATRLESIDAVLCWLLDGKLPPHKKMTKCNAGLKEIKEVKA